MAERKEIRLIAAWGERPAGEVLRVLGPNDDPVTGTVDVTKARDLVERYRLAEWVTSEAPAPVIEVSVLPAEVEPIEPAASDGGEGDGAPAGEDDERERPRRRTRRAE
jgi:hypothetical protein